MKILIADDEKLIRTGIAKIISESFPDETVLEAGNGEKALELCQKEKPEILLTDVQMPVMDGLELMRRIREFDEEISIVVVTGYDDFSYARAALQSGAAAYILKPIDKTELIETVRQLLAEKELTNKEVAEKLLTRGFADGGFSAENESALSFLIPYKVAAVINPAQDLGSEAYNFAPLRKGCLVLLKSNMELPPPKDGSYLAYSRNFSSLEDLDDATLEALVALFERFSEPEERVYFSNGLGYIGDSIAELVGKLNSQLGYNQDADLKKTVDKLFDISDPKIDKNYYLFSLSEALKNGLYPKYEKNDEDSLLLPLKDLSFYFSIDEWKRDLLSFLFSVNACLKKSQPDNSFIPKAITFIENNYQRDINMAVVSNEVGISYTYFSEKFKEYTNSSFNDFLNTYRVERAKELLEKGCYRIYEVAEKCGFSSPRYFIKIFKQSTGLTPTTYSLQKERE